MSTEGAFCIFGELTDTKWTTALLTTVDPCIYCGKSTAFGSGRFVNRLASDVGWGCAECSGYSCDRCGIQMYLDCEVMADQCGGDEAFDDGTVHVCEACLTETEAKAYAKEQS